MSQIEGDLLVHIVQANYRFSTRSPIFFFSKYNSSLVCSVCKFSHFFIILFRLVHIEKQSLGRREISACLTHFAGSFKKQQQPGLHQDPSWPNSSKRGAEGNFSKETLGLDLRGAACTSALSKRQEPNSGAAQELQEQAGLPESEATAALIPLLTLCSLRKGWNVPD